MLPPPRELCIAVEVIVGVRVGVTLTKAPPRDSVTVTMTVSARLINEVAGPRWPFGSGRFSLFLFYYLLSFAIYRPL